MEKGFGYLVAIMDWNSRKVLSWRLSNTLDADFCIQALQAAIQDYGCPEIFNTDQGAQFTAEAWICILKNHGIQISMDGKGRYHDNIFIERLWRTVKYEFLYTRAFNKLHSVFGYRDSDENARDYTHQTTESGFALPPSSY